MAAQFGGVEERPLQNTQDDDDARFWANIQELAERHAATATMDDLDTLRANVTQEGSPLAWSSCLRGLQSVAWGAWAVSASGCAATATSGALAYKENRVQGRNGYRCVSEGRTRPTLISQRRSETV